MPLARRVEAEWLDILPADDPRAVRSRHDLRRINRLMATASLLGPPLDALLRRSTPVRLVELGAGDGQTLLRIAQRRARNWPKVDLQLLDIAPVVGAHTLAAFRALGWDAEVIEADVFDWLGRQHSGSPPVVVASLFLHHFDSERLRALLAGIAQRAGAFVCCEPRRSTLALAGSRLLGLIGCNAVTRHDALVSVRAGFLGRELCGVWPEARAWTLDEGPAGLFSHRFLAVPNAASARSHAP